MLKSLMEQDHAEVDELYSAALDALDARDRQASLQRVDLFWARIAMHIRAEHLHLFPTVLRLADATGGGGPETSLSDLPNVIERLRRDHNEFMDELIRTMKLIRASAAEDDGRSEILKLARESLASVHRALEQHNRIEEERIYSLEELLNASGNANQLERLLRHEITNLPPRFAVGGPQA